MYLSLASLRCYQLCSYEPALFALRSLGEGGSWACPELAEALCAAEGVAEWVENFYILLFSAIHLPLFLFLPDTLMS